LAVQNIQHIGSRSQKFFKFYRWQYNHNWLSYTYKKKFKSSSNSLFFYSNVFWSRFYTSPALRQLGKSLWNNPGNYTARNLKNSIFSQKGLIVGLENNAEYRTKHLIWIFNFRSFRKDLTNYISNSTSFKGQMLFLSHPIQKERNLLWTFKHVIDNEEVIQLDWYKNLNRIKKIFSKKFKTFSNLIHRFIKLHKCIKTLALLVRLNMNKKLWKKNKFIKRKGYIQPLQTFEQALIWKPHFNAINSKSLKNRRSIFDSNQRKYNNDRKFIKYKLNSDKSNNIQLNNIKLNNNSAINNIRLVRNNNIAISSFKNNSKDILNNNLNQQPNKNDIRINYTRRNKNRRRNQRRKLNRNKNKDKTNISK
jgi:hypothetical protein